MDPEKKLLLLHLKSDLRDVLRLAREKSNELIRALHGNDHNIQEKTEDLEYYISSLLDLTREIKTLFAATGESLKAVPLISTRELAEFEELLHGMTKKGDVESMTTLLRTLEEKEHYELCARVNESIRLFKSGEAQPR